MNKKQSIVVLFGPSGSGKTFVGNMLVNGSAVKQRKLKEIKTDNGYVLDSYEYDDIISSFEIIKKATEREIRKKPGKRFVHADESINFGGEKMGAIYYDHIDAMEGDFVIENYGKDYSVDVSLVDSALVQGKTPVIILRSREQMDRLKQLYPNTNIFKFYLRPDIDKVKEKINNDPLRSAESKKSRIDKLESDYSYHDQTAKLDPEHTVTIHNTYTNGTEIEKIIKDKIKDNVNAPQDVLNNINEQQNKIVVGDKIRIKSPFNARFFTNYSINNNLIAEVIQNNQIKFSVATENGLVDLLNQLKTYCDEPLFGEDSPIDEFTQKMISAMTDFGYAIDINISHLGCDYFFAKDVKIPNPPPDYDRDNDVMPYVTIGYKRCTGMARNNHIGSLGFVNLIEKSLDESSRILHPCDYYNKDGRDKVEPPPKTKVEKAKYYDNFYYSAMNNLLTTAKEIKHYSKYPPDEWA